jgi:hypothetical protein
MMMTVLMMITRYNVGFVILVTAEELHVESVGF